MPLQVRQLAVALLLALTTACGPRSPEAEFLSNRQLAEAIRESGFTPHLGTSPMDPRGKWRALAKIVKSSAGSSGSPTATWYCYFGVDSRTMSISSIEYTDDYPTGGTSEGSGSLLSGEGESFTVWKDAKVDLPSCKQRTFVLSSGIYVATGVLDVEHLAVVIEGPCGTPGEWALRRGTFIAKGRCEGKADIP